MRLIKLLFHYWETIKNIQWLVQITIYLSTLILRTNQNHAFLGDPSKQLYKLVL